LVSLLIKAIKEINTNGYIIILAHRHKWHGSKPVPPKTLPEAILLIGSPKLEKYKDHSIANKDCTKITRSILIGFMDNIKKK